METTLSGEKTVGRNVFSYVANFRPGTIAYDIQVVIRRDGEKVLDWKDLIAPPRDGVAAVVERLIDALPSR